MEGCNTGCRKKEHMTKCLKCGEEYHIGLYHSCSTAVEPYNNSHYDWTDAFSGAPY